MNLIKQKDLCKYQHKLQRQICQLDASKLTIFEPQGWMK